MTRLHRSVVFLGLGALATGALLTAPRASAQEPAACLASDPAQWPSASRPYFMLVVDTSGSMVACTNPTPIDDGDGICNKPGEKYCFPQSCPSTAVQNSCGLEPTRINDAKCALRKTV